MIAEAPEPLRVLIATITMGAGTGTAFYTRDLALALLRRGHLPVVYTSQPGALIEELRFSTIPVITDLDDVAAVPDVIHGHHHLETLAALTRFPNTPALFVCHDGLTWHSIPPVGPRIGMYVAVDRNCRDRMMFEHAIPETSIHLLTNRGSLPSARRVSAEASRSTSPAPPPAAPSPTLRRCCRSTTSCSARLVVRSSRSPSAARWSCATSWGSALW
jgi:hypothetical protein